MSVEKTGTLLFVALPELAAALKVRVMKLFNEAQHLGSMTTK